MALTHRRIASPGARVWKSINNIICFCASEVPVKKERAWDFICNWWHYARVKTLVNKNKKYMFVQECFLSTYWWIQSLQRICGVCFCYRFVLGIKIGFTAITSSFEPNLLRWSLLPFLVFRSCCPFSWMPTWLRSEILDQGFIHCHTILFLVWCQQRPHPILMPKSSWKILDTLLIVFFGRTKSFCGFKKNTHIFATTAPSETIRPRRKSEYQSMIFLGQKFQNAYQGIVMLRRYFFPPKSVFYKYLYFVVIKNTKVVPRWFL